VATLDKARQIALQSGIKYSYIGNVPGSEGNNTYCPKCKRLLVERIGFSIRQNNIVASHCKYCSELIDGVWE
jgi:pyruvate formate lyase activating enzyme